jgi:hypothetical protein
MSPKQKSQSRPPSSFGSTEAIARKKAASKVRGPFLHQCSGCGKYIRYGQFHRCPPRKRRFSKLTAKKEAEQTSQTPQPPSAPPTPRPPLDPIEVQPGALAAAAEAFDLGLQELQAKVDSHFKPRRRSTHELLILP